MSTTEATLTGGAFEDVVVRTTVVETGEYQGHEARSAAFSQDDVYRWWLMREWQAGGRTLRWLMLNPSTATHELDDATIRKCRGFSQRYGFQSMLVLNLYAFRARHPVDLRRARQPVGHLNDAYLRQQLRIAAEHSEPVVAAWGAVAQPQPGRVLQVMKMDVGKVLHRLGPPLANGSPRHPVMAAYRNQLEPM